MSDKNSLFAKRCARVRRQLRRVAGERPRLSVFRSGQHIYAQVIDDLRSVTLASASSLEKNAPSKSGGNVEGAQAVGQLIAERAKAIGVSQVVFDRGGYIYHGRVKALAESARNAGLEF